MPYLVSFSTRAFSSRIRLNLNLGSTKTCNNTNDGTTSSQHCVYRGSGETILLRAVLFQPSLEPKINLVPKGVVRQHSRKPKLLANRQIFAHLAISKFIKSHSTVD